MFSYGRYFFVRIIFFIRLFLQYRNIICLLVNYRPNKICNCFSGIRLFYVFNECHDLWRALSSNKNNFNRKFNTKVKLSLLLKERWKLLNILLLGCRCSRSQYVRKQLAQLNLIPQHSCQKTITLSLHDYYMHARHRLPQSVLLNQPSILCSITYCQFKFKMVSMYTFVQIFIHFFVDSGLSKHNLT